MTNGDLAETLRDLGLAAHMAGRLDEAEKHYLEAFKQDSENAEVLHLLGALALQTGDGSRAGLYVGKALTAQPDFPEALNTMGNIRKSEGDLDGAADAFEKAVALVPSFAEAWSNLADVHRLQGRYEAALETCDKALALKPDLAAAHGVKGAIKLDEQSYQQAIAPLRRAIELEPSLWEAQINLSEALRADGDLEEARQIAARSVEEFPESAAAQNSLGNIFYEQRDYIAALKCYDAALAGDGDLADAHLNKGNALARLNRLDEAEIAINRCLALRPEDATALVNLGGVHQAGGKIESALELFEQAFALEPDHADAHWNRGIAKLLTGDLLGGYEDYEHRWRLPEFTARHSDIPLWDGGDLEGRTILIHSEQGYGDTLQFIRYVPMLAGKGAKVIVESHPPLVSLLIEVEGVSSVVARGEDQPAVDVQAPIMSLPYLFKTNLNTIPAEVPYLGLSPTVAIDLGDDSRTLVGIAWAGRPTHKNDSNRSMPLELFAPLAEMPGISLVGLQFDARFDERDRVSWGDDILDIRPQVDDFSDSATAIAGLDLVITVDTAVAHLAGALGKTAWVLLPFAPDWRWMLDRGDSPWYPSVRLFRQSSPSDWAPVMDAVVAALRAGDHPS